MEATAQDEASARLARQALESALAEVQTSEQAEQVIRELRQQAEQQVPGIAQQDAGAEVEVAQAQAIARAADTASSGC